MRKTTIDESYDHHQASQSCLMRFSRKRELLVLRQGFEVELLAISGECFPRCNILRHPEKAVMPCDMSAYLSRGSLAGWLAVSHACQSAVASFSWHIFQSVLYIRRFIISLGFSLLAFFKLSSYFAGLPGGTPFENKAASVRELRRA